MIKILFVCMGNICRSPMADAVFTKMAEDAGILDDIMVDSAGTGSWHVGERAHRGTLNVLNKHGIQYKGRARQLTQRDMTDFDYVLAMDNGNLRKLKSIEPDVPEAELHLFMSYANGSGLTDVTEVPDPYYDGRFDEVYELVHKGSEALLEHIRKTHNL